MIDDRRGGRDDHGTLTRPCAPPGAAMYAVPWASVVILLHIPYIADHHLPKNETVEDGSKKPTEESIKKNPSEYNLMRSSLGTRSPTHTHTTGHTQNTRVEINVNVERQWLQQRIL